MKSIEIIRKSYEKMQFIVKNGTKTNLQNAYGKQYHKQMRLIEQGVMLSNTDAFPMYGNINVEHLLCLITDKKNKSPEYYPLHVEAGAAPKQLPLYKINGKDATLSMIKAYLLAPFLMLHDKDNRLSHENDAIDPVLFSDLTGYSRETIREALNKLNEYGFITFKSIKAPSKYVFYSISMPKYIKKHMFTRKGDEKVPEHLISKTRLGYAQLPFSLVSKLLQINDIAIIRSILMVFLMVSRAIGMGDYATYNFHDKGYTYVMSDIFNSISLPLRSNKASIISSINDNFKGIFEIKSYDYTGIRWNKSKYNRISITFSAESYKCYSPYNDITTAAACLSAEKMDKIETTLNKATKVTKRTLIPTADFTRLFPETFDKISYLDTISTNYYMPDPNDPLFILSDYLEETISYKTYDFISGYKNLVGGLDSVLNTILTTCGTESLVLAVNSINSSRREDLRTIFSSGVNNYQNYDHEKLTGDTYIVKRIKDISKSMEDFGAFLLAKTKQITKNRFGSKEVMLHQSSRAIMQAI